MSVSLIPQILEFIQSESLMLEFPPTTPEVIGNTESELGFSLPPLLKECYNCVANGGFGPGYGLIGVSGGASSAFGSLAETYNQLKTDQESLGKTWKEGLLPFCDWGCNIFSCVDCNDPKSFMYTFDSGDVRAEGYCLTDFFRMWLQGVDILSFSGSHEEVEIVNPFSGKSNRVKKQGN